jgi:cytoskeletal protein CcmA (bactofilin family)
MTDTLRTADASHADRKLGDSTIGEDLKISGQVSAKGEIHIDGEVKGDVSCAALILGQNATVEGNVIAEDVVLRGRLIGSITAMRVTLEATSHVEGDIYHQSLALEQGAFFEGRSCRSENPMALAHAAGPNGAGPKLAGDQTSAGRKEKPTHKFSRSLPEAQSA